MALASWRPGQLLAEPLQQAGTPLPGSVMGQAIAGLRNFTFWQERPRKRNVGAEMKCEQGGRSDEGSEVQTGGWGDSDYVSVTSSKSPSLVSLIIE